MEPPVDIYGASGWVKTYKDSAGKKRSSRSYNRWFAMQNRCNKNSSVHKQYASYRQCIMSEEFLDYQRFANWHTSQIGYHCSDYDLDKDILVKGNKLYSPEACVLIPKALNSFLTNNASKRGEFPQGVSYDNRWNVFKASLSCGNKQKHLGTFSSILEAEQAYATAKEGEAKRWAQRLEDKEFIIDPRVITALINWRL